MKKAVCLFLVLFLLPMVAFADFDLSTLQYDELLTLQQKVNFEIMSRPEWKEVTVPVGAWKVGEDIPAGSYCIKTTDSSTLIVVWRKEIDNHNNHGLVINEIISNKKPYGKLTLEDGWIFTANDPVIFTPPMTIGF